MWTIGLSAPSSSLPTTPNCVVRSTHRSEAMPSRGTLTVLRGVPVRTSWSPTRPSASSCTQVRAIPSTSTGWAENGLRAALRRKAWGYWWMRSSTWPCNVCLQPRRSTVFQAASKEACPSCWGRWFCSSTLLWWDPTCSPASSSGALSTGKTWTCWSRSRGGPRKWTGHLSCEESPSGWHLFPLVYQLHLSAWCCLQTWWCTLSHCLCHWWIYWIVLVPIWTPWETLLVTDVHFKIELLIVTLDVAIQPILHPFDSTSIKPVSVWFKTKILCRTMSKALRKTLSILLSLLLMLHSLTNSSCNSSAWWHSSSTTARQLQTIFSSLRERPQAPACDLQGCIYQLNLCLGWSLCPGRDSCSSICWETFPVVHHHHFFADVAIVASELARNSHEIIKDFG